MTRRNPSTRDKDADRSTRCLDLVLVALSIPIWFPIMILVAATCIILQGRPMLYTGSRLGRQGQPYPMYKFRTMIREADRYLDENGMPTRNRITPWGALLRRLSLDELPQLINVIKGEMSIVGPRPMLPSWLEKIPGGASHPRFRVRPGLTGLAQLDGRNTVVWSQRLRRDAEYVETRSLRSNLAIIGKTPAALLRPTVVYDRNSDAVDDL